MKTDNIVRVNVNVEEMVASAESYGNMLIVGPVPKAPGAATTPDVGGYSSMEELTTAGFASEDPIYDAALLAFKQAIPPKIIYCAVQKNTVESVEDIATTLQRAIDYSADWWAICPVGIAAANVQKMADFVDEKNAKFLVVATTGITDSPIAGEMNRVHVMHETQESDYANVGLAARCLVYQPGAETWQFKAINGLAAQSLTQTEVNGMDAINIGCYVEHFGSDCTFGGKTLSGEWIDVVRFCDWLTDKIQRNVYELFLKQPKVPYTDSGIAMIQSQVVAALQEGQRNGGIAEDETDAEGNVVKGYEVQVPKASSLTSAQRKTRKLLNVTANGRLANAIHFAEISVTLTY